MPFSFTSLSYFLLLLFLLSSAFPLFIWLYQRGYPHGTALNVFLFVVLVEIDCLVLVFLNDFFFHAASVNLWSHSSDLPAVFIAPPHQFIFFGLSPHLPGPRSPTPIFLSFSLFFLFLFCYFSLLSIWWTCLSSFSEEVQEEVKDTRKNPKPHTFPQAIFLFIL